MRRFEALDSWRGLCAILVVVFHLDQGVNWSLRGASAIDNFDLFVDFFFVLSGFVIASAYERRLSEGYGVTPFVLRRFGRIYPLHLATLGAMIIFAFWRVLFPLSEFNPRAAFDGDIFDFTAIFTNLFLVHGIGFENHFTWNFPSWSISAEFYTYVLFALIWSLFVNTARVIVVALALLCPALMFFAPMLPLIPGDVLSVMTLVRSVAGFAAGVLVYRLHQRFAATPRLRPGWKSGLVAELGAVAACALFIGWSEAPIWMAPFVFAFVVFVFAFEAGALSRLLRTPPFLQLGAFSYSIYLVHVVALFYLGWVVAALEAQFGWGVTSPAPDGPGRLWGAAPWIGNLIMFGVLAVVVAMSALTYKFIEKPGRDWGREASNRWRAGGWAGVFASKNVATRRALD